MLRINEVFYSIQGESTRAGWPCVFVRLTGCHLRCRYCDTAYAFHEGRHRSIDDIVDQVLAFGCDLVELTGGEPLLQPNVHLLMTRLCDAAKTVLLETDGAMDITTCDRRVIRIMDLKTPASGEAEQNKWSNIDHLTHRDEVKFVICDRDDYQWARARISEYDLTNRVAAVSLSAVSAVEPGPDITGVSCLSLCDLAQWIMEDKLKVRLQTQLHKLIWDPMTRGV